MTEKGLCIGLGTGNHAPCPVLPGEWGNTGMTQYAGSVMIDRKGGKMRIVDGQRKTAPFLIAPREKGGSQSRMW